MFEEEDTSAEAALHEAALHDRALHGAEEAELAARRENLTKGPRDELVSPLADADERVIESALRPKRLTEFIGQVRVREQLSLILQSALRRGRPPDHVLLAGPPGLGKTTIAMIVAAELGAPLPIPRGPAIAGSGGLRAGLLPAPLRDRFGFTAHLDFYQPDELEIIIRRSAGLLAVTLTDEAAVELSTRSRGPPRIANRLLRRVRDYAEVRADGVVTGDIARTALEIYEVDEHGLDRLDRGVLEAVVRRFGGGPVGRSTLAGALGEEAETVEVVAEPFLVRCGLLARTPRGRVATAAGWSHLGLEPPPTLSEVPALFD